MVLHSILPVIALSLIVFAVGMTLGSFLAAEIVQNVSLELRYNKIPFLRRIPRPNRLRNPRETAMEKVE